MTTVDRKATVHVDEDHRSSRTRVRPPSSALFVLLLSQFMMRTQGYRPARQTPAVLALPRGGAKDASSVSSIALSKPFLDNFQQEVHHLVAEYRSEVRDTFQRLRQDIELMGIGDDSSDDDDNDDERYDEIEEDDYDGAEDDEYNDTVSDPENGEDETLGLENVSETEEEPVVEPRRRPKRKRNDVRQKPSEPATIPSHTEDTEMMTDGEVIELDDPSETKDVPTVASEPEDEELVEESQEEYLEDHDTKLSNTAVQEAQQTSASENSRSDRGVRPEPSLDRAPVDDLPDSLLGLLLPPSSALRTLQMHVLKTASLVFTIAIFYIMITIVLRILQVSVLKR